MTALLTPPKSKPKPRARAKVKAPLAVARKAAAVKLRAPSLKSRAAQPASAAVKPSAVRRAPEKVAEPGVPATGKWLVSNFSGLSDSGGTVRMRRMSYWLYLPDSVPADGGANGGMPLVVMLHGCDQSATLFAQGTRMNQLAEKEGYAVLYPQQSVSGHPRRCWKWYDRATQQGGGDVRLIVGIVNKVIENYPIDRSRIYICGISAGAGMANIVALNHPELFAGLGLHSSPLFGAGHSTVGALAVMQHGAVSRVEPAIAEVMEKRTGFSPLPTILIQGEDDTVVRPVNQAQLTRQAMLVNRIPLDSPMEVVTKGGGQRGPAYRVHDVYRNRKLMLRVARIAELRHAWSGGDERLQYNSGAGPDASKMMLDFFGRHRRAV